MTAPEPGGAMEKLTEWIESVQARAEKATPGSWSLGDGPDEEHDRCVYGADGVWVANVGNWTLQSLAGIVDAIGKQYGYTDAMQKPGDWNLRQVYEADERDAAFIAAARTDVPALCRLLRAALEVIETDRRVDATSQGIHRADLAAFDAVCKKEVGE